MRYTLNCKKCNRFLGEFDLQKPEEITTLILQTHATGNHSGAHELELLPVPLGNVRVQITCKAAGCQYFEKEEIYEVPAYYVPAVVIMFHARNEGHKFILKIDGKEISPLTEIKKEDSIITPTIENPPLRLPDPEPPHAEYGGSIRKINVPVSK